MGSVFGKKLKISVFGQSHSEAIGVSIDGFPHGFCVDMEKLKDFLSKRAPGQGKYTTQRHEADIPEFICGLVNNTTCGAPICAVIRNTDVRSQDYAGVDLLPRPSHSDYSAYIKYNGKNDVRGGGHFSGRLTAPVCVAGGMCIQLLDSIGIKIGAHIAKIGSVSDRPFDLVNPQLDEVVCMPLAVLDSTCGEKMLECIEAARIDGDSVGGVVECAVIGVPAGLGEAIFESVESRLSSAIFSIPAVRGVEFGMGFAAAELRGSQHNDSFILQHNRVATQTNNHAGALGGITTGMPIVFKVGIKPTPSIAISQKTVNLSTFTEQSTSVRGRHDPCIVPRAVPVVEAMAAIVILDMLLERYGELLKM